MPFAQRRAHLMRDRQEPRRLAHVQIALARQVARRSPPPRAPGRDDITTMRVDRNTASRTECVTNTAVSPGAAPQLVQMQSQAVARDLVQRAERLVHQQQLRFEAQRAGDGDALLHPARQLPWETAGGTPPARPDPEPARHGARVRRAACPSLPAAASRCVRRCATDTAPAPGTRSHRPGGGRASSGVVPFTVSVPTVACVQIGDQPQQRRLAAARRPDQRYELAPADRQIDVGQRDRLAGQAKRRSPRGCVPR